jgi:hypothetical protein
MHALAVALRVIHESGQSLGSHEALLEQFPFVSGYLDEAEALGVELGGTEAVFDWETEITIWQATAPSHLPLQALAESFGLDFVATSLFVAVGLLDEDDRFGALFEVAQGTPGQQRPTLSLLNAWWRNSDEAEDVRPRLRRLRELGLIEVVNPDAPRSSWALQVPALLWDALRGELSEVPAPFLRYLNREAISRAPEPVLAEPLRAKLERLPALIRAGGLDAAILRGPQRNGRRTIARWLARSLERSMLEIELSGKPELDRERLRVAAPLSVVLGALSVLVADIGPGETLTLPSTSARSSTSIVVLGSSGGVGGPGCERAINLPIEIPSAPTRARLLAQRLGASGDFADLAERFRMTSGNLQRAAALAEAQAVLDSRTRIELDDFRRAARALGRQALDTLATHVESEADWSHFAAGADTTRELELLENRCKHRERLGQLTGDALALNLNPGVRALFQGPSGTGKTLAAKLLAGSLRKDLYRVDLSAVVNKYIGETEKNLARIFAVAEELDVIILLDEGDALLTRRTAVGSANDRYANLETNYLLQRIESFEGIVLITTNAAESIDGAFQRRMDVVVDFRPPEAAERWALWQMHLPSEHQIDAAFLREVAARCQLTGGQIRNAVLHASLLSLGEEAALSAHQLEKAIQREYRKSGAVCPLRVISLSAVGRA